MEVIHDGDEESQMNLLHERARMMAMADQPEEVITVANEFLLLNKNYPGIGYFSFGEVAQVKHWQAQAYSDCGKWKDAVKSYKSLIGEHKQRGEASSPSPSLFPSTISSTLLRLAAVLGFSLWRDGKWKDSAKIYNSLVKEHTQRGADMILIDYTRVLYELRKYDEAIEFGNMAIELNRSRPGVHKYVVLSRKANGDIDEAKKTMARAILYEHHWDEDNLQKNKQLLRELNNL